jgi:hypothetical protein
LILALSASASAEVPLGMDTPLDPRLSLLAAPIVADIA